MWPRPIGRGILYVIASHSASKRCGFNVAASDRTRNHLRKGRGRQFAAEIASMWPRPIGRGIRRGYARFASLIVASMWPRPIGRGILECLLRRVTLFYASMWPRPIGRGITQCVTEHIVNAAGFNVAASDRTRNRRDSRFQYSTDTASMWPRPIGRGIRSARSRISPTLMGFNVAASDRTRNPATVDVSRRRSVRFNVAASDRTRNPEGLAVATACGKLLQCGRVRSDAESRQ